MRKQTLNLPGNVFPLMWRHSGLKCYPARMKFLNWPSSVGVISLIIAAVWGLQRSPAEVEGDSTRKIMQHLLPAHKFTRVQKPPCPHTEASDVVIVFINERGCCRSASGFFLVQSGLLGTDHS